VVSAANPGLMGLIGPIGLIGLLGLLAACGGGPAVPLDVPLAGDGPADLPLVLDVGPGDRVGDTAAPDVPAEKGGPPDGGPGDGGAGDATPLPCPDGVICVDSFPFRHQGDTTQAPAGTLDGYSCSPDTDESGPEVLYRVTVPATGFLSAAVYDADGVDVDVHILSDRDAATCLDRGDKHARADVGPGYAWVIVDTYVSGGVPQVGPYTVDIGFIEPSTGPCALESGELARVNDGGNHLQLPATGPIVVEAHLVTQEEPEPYPQTSTDELQAHYELSQARSGLVMYRSQVWAPLEGGSFYGAGIGDPALFPVLDEAWYVNMYWTSSARPPRGTRMILRDPQGGPRATVVAGGYETGPGNLEHIAGTPEETHFYMGTTHLDELTIGFATDQSLPLGPRTCTD
jgi:hypothetical protein